MNFLGLRQSRSESPIVFASKKDGSVQLCIEYKKMNNKTVNEAYIIP